MRKQHKSNREQESWVWSPTQLKSLYTCPYQFYLRYVKGIKTEPTEEIKMGLRIHDQIFEDLKNGTSNNPVSPLIKKLINTLEEKDVARITIEPQVELVQVIDGIPARIRGLPDILGQKRLYDFKTTRFDALHRVGFGDRLQMTIYSLATKKAATIIKIPREGHPFIERHDIDLDKAVIAELPRLIRMGREILAGSIPKPNTRACRYCFMQDVCPFSLQNRKEGQSA